MSVRKLLGAACATLILCIVVTGCSSTNRVETKTESPGQQLMELQEAKEKGLITDREYEKMRRKIVRDSQ